MASSTAQHHRLPGSDEAAPYALCPFPAPSGTGQQQQQQQQEVALFGGEDGILYVLPSASAASTEPRPVRTFDDRVRSLAVSDDGRRVAVGLESGETKIFAYDSPYSGDGDDDTTNLHPFLNPASAAGTGDDDGMGGTSGMGDDDDDDDGFGGMMSQEDGPSPTKSPSSAGVTEFAGPRFDAPIRALAFLPTPNEKYYLAVATESPASFCVVDVKTAETAGGERYLQSEAEASHDSAGVRGLAVGKLVQVSRSRA